MSIRIGHKNTMCPTYVETCILGQTIFISQFRDRRNPVLIYCLTHVTFPNEEPALGWTTELSRLRILLGRSWERKARKNKTGKSIGLLGAFHEIIQLKCHVKWLEVMLIKKKCSFERRRKGERCIFLVALGHTARVYVYY
jgi:hypothetical protein